MLLQETDHHKEILGDRHEDKEVLIECKDVHKSFGDKRILCGASFKVFFILKMNIYYLDVKKLVSFFLFVWSNFRYMLVKQSELLGHREQGNLPF